MASGVANVCVCQCMRSTLSMMATYFGKSLQRAWLWGGLETSSRWLRGNTSDSHVGALVGYLREQMWCALLFQ